MNLMDLFVKISVKDEASKEVDSISSKLRGGIASAAMVAGAAIGSVAAATGALGKTALESYAQYEQLVGGIDTLFKDSSSTVQQYAADAYKNAGVSANRYMEISTSFAASLISSLGGDTAAAAEMANTAINDMSDNANKMGTSLDVVQEAYMSLARGNYEMLDSLKLGYGGTKAELERLLSDAEQFAAAQGEVRDFSVDSYADIVEAIHLVQQNMDITGTTAKEAATTIGGSINTAKAAWDNWLTGLGNSDADMGELTQQLLDSIASVADNVAPAVRQIGTSIANNLPSALSRVGETLAPVLRDGLVFAWNTAAGALRGLGIQLPEIDSSTVEGAFNALSNAVKLLTDNANWLVPALAAVAGGLMAFQVASSIAAGVQALQTAFTAWRTATEGMTIAQAALNVVMNANPFVLIVTIIGTLVAAFVTLMATNEGFRNAVMNAWTQIQATASAVWGAIVNFFTAGIPNAINSMVTWFQQLPTNIANFLNLVITNVSTWVANMATQAVQAGSQFLNNVVSFIQSVPGRVGGFFSSAVSNAASFASDMASNALSAGQQFLDNIVSKLKDIPDRVFSIGRDIVNGIVDGINSVIGNIGSTIKGGIDSAIGGVKSFLGIASPSKYMRDQVGRWIPAGIAEGIADYSSMPVKTMGELAGELSDSSNVSVGVNGSSGATSLGDVVNAVQKLHDDLGRIIKKYAPTATPREFARAVRSV